MIRYLILVGIPLLVLAVCVLTGFTFAEALAVLVLGTISGFPGLAGRGEIPGQLSEEPALLVVLQGPGQTGLDLSGVSGPTSAGGLGSLGGT